MVKNVLTYSVVLMSMSLVSNSFAATPAEIAAALRISGTITGGSIPTNSPEFQSMLTSIASNDYYGAALTAVQSNYGTNYLLRRLALQMQNPGLDASIVKDNDASAFLMAHFAGAQGVTPSISKIWSNNLTCSARVTRAGVVTTVKVADLTAAEKLTIDWKNALTCVNGQQVVDAAAPQPQNNAPFTKITLPAKHVGGYLTLSDRPGDTSFAEYGATAGTNLRLVVGMWGIATGMDIVQFAAGDGRAQQVPRFVPSNDPNFLVGQGQSSCISCHAGGLVALNHGYGTMADLFNFDADRGGFMFYTTPATGTRKSLGSNGNRRGNTLTCNMTTFTECNADSVGTDVNQSWDLAPTWGARGLLNTLGWQGPTAGQGLNTLGTAIGKANIVYANLAKRIQGEVCPLATLTKAEISNIAAIGQSSDDIRQMIAQVAANPSCR